MPLRLAEKTDDAPHSAATTVAMDEHHKWNLLLHVSVIFHAPQLLLEIGISPASVYHILTNSLGKGKVRTNWIPHVLDNEQRATHCSHHYPSAALETWRQWIPWLHFCSWEVTDAFIWPL